MTVLDTRAAIAIGPATASEGRSDRPGLGTVCRRVALTLLIACVIPATLFYVSVVVAGVWFAIFVALAWSYGAIAWRRLTGRRTCGLLILTAIVMTCRTVVAMVADSTFLYFLQPVISDGVVATTFLLSLATARPMVARLAGDFYPMDHELAERPRIQRLFWHLTALWATLYLGKATMTLWLLLSQSLETFVLVKGICVISINALAIIATICAATVVARREGLVGPVPAERLVATLASDKHVSDPSMHWHNNSRLHGYLDDLPSGGAS